MPKHLTFLTNNSNRNVQCQMCDKFPVVLESFRNEKKQYFCQVLNAAKSKDPASLQRSIKCIQMKRKEIFILWIYFFNLIKNIDRKEATSFVCHSHFGFFCHCRLFNMWFILLFFYQFTRIWKRKSNTLTHSSLVLQSSIIFWIIHVCGKKSAKKERERDENVDRACSP